MPKRNFCFLIFVLYIRITVAQIAPEEFVSPPLDARPSTYWEWMNGNISERGITSDLEYMKQAHYGAAMIFNVGIGIPQGKTDYNSASWQHAVLHAVKEADRLGLRLSMHNAPGYSGTGGPWITPEKSMKELVWSETHLTGDGKSVQKIKLPQPISKMGFYRDARIIAYPSTSSEKDFRELVEKVFVCNKSGEKNIVDKSVFLDNDLTTEFRLENDEYLVFELSEPIEIQSATILRGKREQPADPHDGPRDYAPLIMLEVADDGEHFCPAGQFNCAPLRAMDTPGTLSCRPVSARYIKISTNRGTHLAEIDVHGSPRLENYAAKINYTHGSVPLKKNCQYVRNSDVIDHRQIIDISAYVDANGILTWIVPEGVWTLLRIGYTTTGEVVAAAPNSGTGLECDKFDSSALDLHFEKHLVPLLETLRPWCGNTLEALVIDSWEAGMQNWTELFPEYFKTRRGYDITPYLPAITGRIIDSVEATECFLWDFRRTQADMFLEKYIGHFKRRLAEYSLTYTGEAYGDGNFESLEFAARQDCPMSEFWTHYIYGNISTTYLAASTAHIWNRPIVACECYTGTPFNSKFTEHPYGMKALGDYIMTAGVNRFVYHAAAHQPYTGSQCGNIMTMGPFGTHLDRMSTWARQFGALNLYNARCAYMLQQGRFVADVLYIKDESISSGVKNYNVESPATPYGYRWDIADASVLQMLSVKEGKIILPHGMTYRLIVIAPQERSTPETLQHLLELSNRGASILLPDEKPTGYTGLDPDKEYRVKLLADSLWAQAGKGSVYIGKALNEILKDMNLLPDFEYTAQNKDAQIHFIHRTCDKDEIYFISNHRRRAEILTAVFRVTGKTPYLWNAMTGETNISVPYETREGKTYLNLSLEESGSIFVVFRPGDAQPASIEHIEPQTTPIYGRSGKKEFSTEYDFHSTFSIALWAKPETFAASGRGMLLYPAPGYNEHSAQTGLSLGQNGIRIYERSANKQNEVLAYMHPIEGWTHIILVYCNGTPSLYLNGKCVATGIQSAYDCIPPADVPQAEEQYIATFEGDQTSPIIYDYILSDREILASYKSGLPAPHQKGVKIKELSNNWEVHFPTWSKAPEKIKLNKLLSLHRHSDFNVKHFAGTATYTKTFVLSAKEWKSLKEKNVILDLGRVENIAEINMNESDTLLVWKAPYEIDISPYLKSGTNTLTIKVTNLYPNRIIGDEHLPEVYDYDEYGRIVKLPEWYLGNESEKRERVLFLPWKYYSAESPLSEAGLLGPVGLFIR